MLVLLGIATFTEVAFTSHFWVLKNPEQNKTPNLLNSLIPGNLLLANYFYLRYLNQDFFVDIIRICHLKWGISLWIGLYLNEVYPFELVYILRFLSGLKGFDIALFWGQICESWSSARMEVEIKPWTHSILKFRYMSPWLDNNNNNNKEKTEVDMEYLVQSLKT